MELQTLGWIVAGWLAASIAVSLALGWFLREVNTAADESELDQVLSRGRVVRYLRGRKPDRKPAVVRNKPADEKIRRNGA